MKLEERMVRVETEMIAMRRLVWVVIAILLAQLVVDLR